MLAKSFFPVGVSTDAAVFRSRGGGAQCTRDFEEGEKPKQTILCVVFYFLVPAFHTGSDVAMYNSSEKSTD